MACKRFVVFLKIVSFVGYLECGLPCHHLCWDLSLIHIYAKDLKYPQGSLVYGGDDEDDFLYYLLDSKEVNVCRDMMSNMGFLKLKLGFSTMSKDQLAESLAYNSLNVYTF